MWSFDKYLRLSSYDDIAKDHFQDNAVETTATEYANQEADKKPTTRKRRQARIETEEKEEPTTRKRTRQPANEDKKEAPWSQDECSYGHTYGKDLNQTPDCQSCTEEEFEKCLAIKNGPHENTQYLYEGSKADI